MDQHKDAHQVGVTSAPRGSSPARAAEAYCPICGRDGDPGLTRFGHLFCSEAHLAQFAEERRAKADPVRAAPAAPDEKSQGKENHGMACGMGTKRGLRAMGWCIAAGLGLLIALPLLAWGGVAATAGSLLTVVAFLACPIGMYLMMRAMMKTQHEEHQSNKDERK